MRPLPFWTLSTASSRPVSRVGVETGSIAGDTSSVRVGCGLRSGCGACVQWSPDAGKENSAKLTGIQVFAPCPQVPARQAGRRWWLVRDAEGAGAAALAGFQLGGGLAGLGHVAVGGLQGKALLGPGQG